MTRRPVYMSNPESKNFVDIANIEFKWHPDFAVSQKQKSIESLHQNFKVQYSNKRILEISSKSTVKLGAQLSAFNLTFDMQKMNKEISVESAFQSSKVFKKGGPYTDLLEKTSKEAKTDVRLKESGDLLYFIFNDRKWPLEPKTLFYDWLYINALWKHSELVREIINYDAFSDIEFNPEKSINCQARSVALFVSLHKLGYLEMVISSPEEYIKILSNERSIENKKTNLQLNLFDQF